MARQPQEDNGLTTIARASLESITSAARIAAPAECCGLLLGFGTHIVEAAATRNIASQNDRFVIDPADHITIRRETRRRNLEVVGFYHSHPHSPPEPSETDRAEAAYPDSLYLIVSLAGGEAEARLFRLENGEFVAEPFVVGA